MFSGERSQMAHEIDHVRVPYEQMNIKARYSGLIVPFEDSLVKAGPMSGVIGSITTKRARAAPSIASCEFYEYIITIAFASHL